jgi:PadR family transcriptional regulator PadR
MRYLQQWLKGVVDLVVLSLVSRLPMYGYQIIKELEKRAGGYLKFGNGTVYPALLRLEKRGLVISKWRRVTQGRGRRYYQITEKGRQFLAEHARLWRGLHSVVGKFLQEGASSLSPEQRASGIIEELRPL